MTQTVKAGRTKARTKAPRPAAAPRKPRLAPCGRFKRDFCERGISGLLEGCRTDRAAMKRIGRQNCVILQCLEERSLNSCTQCEAKPCVFQDRLDQLCPAGTAMERGRAWRLVALSPNHPGSETGTVARARVPDRSVSRLRWYLAALEHFQQAGVKVVSSADLGAKIGVNPSLVRRDLSYFGQFGTPSRGYQVSELHKSILSVFEVVQERSLAWVGAERLLADVHVVEQFARHNWQVVAVFDPDAKREGEQIAGVTVHGMSHLKRVAAEQRIDAAVVAVRDEQAQRVANRLVEAGIDALLNLTTAPLVVPEKVAVQQADIATQLLLLSYRASLLPEGKAT